MSDVALTHDAIWVRQLAKELKLKGHPVRRLLAEAGLDGLALDDDRAEITIESHATFFELAADALGDDCLGLHFGRTRDARDAGLIAYVGLSSPTLVDVLRNLSRYRRVFSEAIEIDVGELESRGRLRWGFRIPASLRSRQSLEFAMANLLNALRKSTSRRLTPMSLSLAHPRNHRIREFERYFGCPVNFGRGENVVEFKLRDLPTPVLTKDIRLLEILRTHCEDVLSRRPQKPTGLQEKVERVITSRLADGAVKLEDVATELGMSSRTLSRRLAEQDLSFNAILEKLRKDLAVKFLQNSNLSLTEIAFLLGYSEISTFSHAFKRWTGKSPAAMRPRRAGS